MKKITVITPHPESLIIKSLRATLLREDIFDSVNAIDCLSKESLNMDQRHFEYALILIDDNSKKLLYGNFEQLAKIYKRGIIILPFINLSFEDVKILRKQCPYLLLIDPSTSTSEFKKYIKEWPFKEFTLSTGMQRILYSSMINEATKQNTLTAKQKMILDLYETGHSIRQTAEKLQLSTYTVAGYRSSIIKKFNAKSMAGVSFILRNNIFKTDIE